MLKHDQPENKGVENGIKRAKQMTEIRWSPVAPIASSIFYYTKDGREYADTFMQPGLPEKGMIYSSVLKNQKFVGYNVSLETFMTALTDPKADVYTKNLHGAGRKNAGCWYGIVCSCFASYVHDLPDRTICKDWPLLPDVAFLGRLELNRLKLLDIILNTKKHIAVITDILRDEEGNVKLVEVSEATLPQCRATYFTPEEFNIFWYGREFDIYRRDDLSEITYEPSPFVRVEEDAERGIEGDPVLEEYEYNKALMPSQGNASNYQIGEDIFIDLLDETYTYVKVTDDKRYNGVFQTEEGRVTVTGLPAGSYKAWAEDEEEGRKSEPVEFTVTDIRLRSGKKTYAPGGNMTFVYTNVGNEMPYLYNINRVTTGGEVLRGYLSLNEQSQERFTRKAPEEPGEYFAYVTARNENGVYTSNQYTFTVSEPSNE